MKLFISYSHVDDLDNHICEQIKKVLGYDFEVWFDKNGLRGGEAWWHRIKKEIDESVGIICLLSENWLASSYCQKEYDRAFISGKYIVPILIAPLDLSKLTDELQTKEIRKANKTKEGVFDTNSVVDLMNAVSYLKTAEGKRAKSRLSVSSVSKDWCEIPEGNVVLDYGHLGQKSYLVSRFMMSKYPISNSQFKSFILNGYRFREFWGFSEDAYQWRLNNREASEITDEEDCPKINVSWYEAMAFCKWLSHESVENISFRLPTELEWQRAAQGDDNRLYPWGDKFDKALCNTAESGIGRTTFVTSYGQGASPFGVCNLTGNTWEWCLNDNLAINSSDLRSINPRVIRGGSWADDADTAKITNRQSKPPDYQSNSLGFRIAYAK